MGDTAGLGFDSCFMAAVREPTDEVEIYLISILKFDFVWLMIN